MTRRNFLVGSPAAGLAVGVTASGGKKDSRGLFGAESRQALAGGKPWADCKSMAGSRSGDLF